MPTTFLITDRFESLQKRIGEWADRIFLPKKTYDEYRGVLNHIEEEIKELRYALWLHDYSDGEIEEVSEECADIAIMLMHIAESKGFSLLTAIEKKHEKNRNRRWGKPDQSGIIRHVKEGEES